MVWRKRVLYVVGVLSVLLVVSAVFASGVVPTFTLNIIIPGDKLDSSGPTVFVDPAAIIKDYVNDPGYQVGSKFYVHINVTEMTDLFTWQLNLTWNHAVLNFTKRVIYGDFLYRTTSPDKTSRTSPIVGGDNVTGYGWAAETILGNYAGITGAGRLVSIEFQVVGYGWSNLIISTTGVLPTKLLDSNGNNIVFTGTDGYFRNKLTGDINGDKAVDRFDFGLFASAYGSSGGPPPTGNWNREADLNNDNTIDRFDFGVFAQNYGRSTP